MTLFFDSMVVRDHDACHPFFYSFCHPQSPPLLRTKGPVVALRDLGVAWDSVTALHFWQQQQQQQQSLCYQDEERILHHAVVSTLEHYLPELQQLTGTSPQASPSPSSNILDRPNIAHASFVLLVALGLQKHSISTNGNTWPEDSSSLLKGLVRGILAQQRSDGAFRIQFAITTTTTTTTAEEAEDYDVDPSSVCDGIEFYPGEAMVGLMEYYAVSKDDSLRDAILQAMLQAFCFYSDYYSVQNPDINYSIWQIQAFARLWDVLHQQQKDTKAASVEEVAAYVLALCDDILASRSWKELARGRSFYPNLRTVEMACGLDSLAQGIRILQLLKDDGEDCSRLFQDDDPALEDKLRYYWIQTKNAVEFLGTVQDQIQNEDEVGYGGLGYGGVQALEQRLDVTGHAMSAFIRLHEIVSTCRLREHS